MISKVAQLNILNEHLAKDNSFLNNAQKVSKVQKNVANCRLTNSLNPYIGKIFQIILLVFSAFRVSI